MQDAAAHADDLIAARPGERAPLTDIHVSNQQVTLALKPLPPPPSKRAPAPTPAAPASMEGDGTPHLTQAALQPDRAHRLEALPAALGASAEAPPPPQARSALAQHPPEARCQSAGGTTAPNMHADSCRVPSCTTKTIPSPSAPPKAARTDLTVSEQRGYPSGTPPLRKDAQGTVFMAYVFGNSFCSFCDRALS